MQPRLYKSSSASPANGYAGPRQNMSSVLRASIADLIGPAHRAEGIRHRSFTAARSRVWVKSAERDLGNAIAHVRCKSDSDRIGAPGQSAAPGHFRTHA